MARKSSKPQPQYLLKHRLTGAAILISTAVLVIPLMLKEPGIQASIDEQPVAVQTEKPQAFESKIKPLNLKSLNLGKKDFKDGDDLKPALLDTKEITPAQPVKGQDTGTATVEKEDNKQKPKSTQQETQGLVLTKENQSESTTSVAAQSTSKDTDKSAVNNSESGNQETDTALESGWTVRVGTFTKIENVETVAELLEKSGFNARRTDVTTNFGPATRVWLGPYEDKETAKKVSVRLRTLTGEEGYVTKNTAS